MIDLYQDVTDRIVAAIEAGTPPWVKPWSVSDFRPRNAKTQRPYRGVNSVLLGLEADLRGFKQPQWLTFRQATELGARVRAGAQGTTVVFYKLTELPEQSADRTAIQYRTVPLLRSFTVFNVAQIDGLPESMTKPPEPAVWDAHVEAEALLYASGAEIHHGGDQAYYQRAKDIVHLPPRSSFAAAGDYYATALHELVHWTGHETRCNRNLTGRFGDDAYAVEELVAELGSAMLCAHCRIDGQLQHPAYLRAWLQVLKADKRAIFTASAKAQAGADFVLRTQQPAQAEEVAA